jgi:hypothetical protein
MESDGSTGKNPTEDLLYWPSDIARSIQQDRSWIFFRTARKVEVSKFFYYMALKVTRGQSTKSDTFAKTNCKSFSLG